MTNKALPQSVFAWNALLDPDSREIGHRLAQEIAAGLPEAEARIWHAHPVWFLEDNPIVGDLPPGRPSFITRVLGVDSGRFRLWQARRGRSPQIAQAPGALLRGSGCPARNAA